MELQDSRPNQHDPSEGRRLAMTRAKRRLSRLKLTSAAASVLTFGGLTAGIATHGIGSQAVAAATSTGAAGTTATKVSTSVSTAATSTPTATASTPAPTSATTAAPIVSAQS